jgi:hypothetical protein
MHKRGKPLGWTVILSERNDRRISWTLLDSKRFFDYGLMASAQNDRHGVEAKRSFGSPLATLRMTEGSRKRRG